MKYNFTLLFALITTCLFAQQRNVVLIIADDVGTDYFGFYEDHQDTAAMPNIWRLLSNGVRFTNATSNPVCSPTRAGMLTGRYSFRTGVGDVVMGQTSTTISTDEVTIPLLLKQYDSNIRTANIGKWHLSNSMPVSNLLTPNQLGYDHYAGSFIGALPDYFNWEKVTNGVTSTSTTYATTQTANDAIQWIQAQNGAPFFAWLAFNAPHTPFHLPPAGLHSYTNLTGTTPDINAQPKAYFKASLEALDHEIGRIFDALEASNQFDQTDIIFIGDNGNGIRTAQIANTDRAKGTIYQYGVKVPFIISGPSVEQPNRVSDALVNTHDLFATILEMMGYSNWSSQIPAARPVDSKSILPVLQNNSTEIRPWAFTEIFKTVTDAADGKAMRNLDYKLLQFDDGRQEFYHLADDPFELNDLLLGSLTANERNNYRYLCQEMSTLLSRNDVCEATVAVQEVSEKQRVQLFPNPMLESSQLVFEEAQQGTLLEVFNVWGHTLLSASVNGFSYTLTKNGFPAGTYGVRITSTKGEVQVLKMVVQ